MTRLHKYFVDNSARLKRVAHTAEALLLIAVIAGSSAVATWWYAQNSWREEKVTLRQDHLAEIERLQEAYGTRLDRVTGKVSAVAASVEAAANQADAAAATSQEAAALGLSAAKQSLAATQKVTTAVNKVNESLEKTPEPTRAQINRKVVEANKQIAK